MTLLVSPAPARRPPRRRRRLGAIAVVLVVVAAVVVSVIATRDDGSVTDGTTMLSATARHDDRAFLDGWVDGDGRVVRHDQGGDTVSEGQAYGLLVALSVGDRDRFAAIWRWTEAHLRDADGTLAWRWVNGSVTDEQPASDADTDAATALLVAGRAWDVPAYTTAGEQIAAATLRTSTVPARPGLLLAAGPWAAGRGGGTVYVDPDYLAPGTATRLADLTGDRRWHEVAAATAVMDRALLTSTSLPPDWVTLAPGAAASQVVASPAPGAGGVATYGLSAPRLLVRLASSCEASDRALAARADPAAAETGAVAIRALDGAAQVSWQHPLTDVAAAAVRDARGDRGETDAALRSAAALQKAAPTYYGAAWLALGTTLLSAGDPAGCAEGSIA